MQQGEAATNAEHTEPPTPSTLASIHVHTLMIASVHTAALSHDLRRFVCTHFVSPGYLNCPSLPLLLQIHLHLPLLFFPQKPERFHSAKRSRCSSTAQRSKGLPPCRNGGTPANAVVKESLRVWAFSRWRGSTKLARGFLRAGFHHLLTGSPPMFILVEQCPHANAPPVGLIVHLTNRFDAYHLLGKVYWCGCEFIAFTTYNIFTNFESIFPARDRMHSLPYHLGDNGLEEEEY
ncbi:Auxin-induced protein 5NG4 [Hordeum vulgare]|nr:Auxin-induced protein 5NG4 [Hordeum vulgare]